MTCRWFWYCFFPPSSTAILVLCSAASFFLNRRDDPSSWRYLIIDSSMVTAMLLLILLRVPKHYDQHAWCKCNGVSRGCVVQLSTQVLLLTWPSLRSRILLHFTYLHFNYTFLTVKYFTPLIKESVQVFRKVTHFIRSLYYFVFYMMCTIDCYFATQPI